MDPLFISHEIRMHFMSSVVTPVLDAWRRPLPCRSIHLRAVFHHGWTERSVRRIQEYRLLLRRLLLICSLKLSNVGPGQL